MYWSKIRIIVGIIVFCFACNVNELEFNDLELQNLKPVVVAPLGTFEYTMQELIEELNDDLVEIGTDADQVIILTFKDSSSFSLSDEFIAIDDVNGEGSVFPEQSVAPIGTTVRIPFEEEFIYVYEPTGDERLDSVFYDNGTVIFNVESTCSCSFEYSFEIENTRNVNTDAPLAFSGILNFDGSNNPSDEQVRSLVDHKTILNDDANNFRSVFRGEIIIEPGQILKAEDELKFEFLYKDQDFQKIFGLFGQDSITIDGGIIEIDLFEDALSSGIVFEGPEIQIDFENRFGIPIGILTDSIYAKNNSGDSVFLSGTVPDNPQIIAFSRDDIFEPALSTVTINSANSNIRDLFNLAPNQLTFPVTGISNFNNTDNFNYVTDSSDIKANATFTLPLRFRLEDFTQKVDFDIEGTYDNEEIDSLFMQIVTRNNLPFIAEMEISINDSTGAELFKIPESVVIEIPIFNAVGDIVSDSETISKFPLGPAGIEALKTGSDLSINLVLNSPSNNVNDFFSILSTNGIRVEVGVGASGEIEL
ncbi:MAG: hypothetical protein AAFQ94_19715 [Bacteroidota bacterium]